jgi:hypothetical protein
MHLSPNKMQREFANASFLLLSLFRFFCSFLSQHNRSIFTSRQSCTAKTLPHSCHLFSKLSLSKFTIFSLLFLSSLSSTYLVHLILHSIFSLVHGPEIIVVSFYIFLFRPFSAVIILFLYLILRAFHILQNCLIEIKCSTMKRKF